LTIQSNQGDAGPNPLLNTPQSTKEEVWNDKKKALYLLRWWF